MENSNRQKHVSLIKTSDAVSKLFKETFGSFVYTMKTTPDKEFNRIKLLSKV